MLARLELAFNFFFCVKKTILSLFSKNVYYFLGWIKKRIWRLKCVGVYSSFSVVKRIAMIF